MKTLDQMIKADKLYDKALKFAILAHDGQKREDGTDFVNHPITVAHVVEHLAPEFGLEEFVNEAMVIAVLHDVIEETDVTYRQLLDNFPFYIVRGVKTLTRIDEEGYGDYIKRIMEDRVCCMIKIADIEHNMRTIEGTKMSAEKKRRRYKKYEYYHAELVQLLLGHPEAGLE